MAEAVDSVTSVKKPRGRPRTGFNKREYNKEYFEKNKEKQLESSLKYFNTVVKANKEIYEQRIQYSKHNKKLYRISHKIIKMFIDNKQVKITEEFQKEIKELFKKDK